MKNLKNKLTMLSGAAVLAPMVGTTAWAGVPESFTPLTDSATTGSNLAAPFDIPAGFTQTFITDRATLGFGGASNGNWDMIAFDPTGDIVFLPFETGNAAGIGRYDRTDGSFVQGALGNGTGTFETDPSLWSSDRALDGTDDFGAVDPAEWTPNGTVLWAEEWSGSGSMIEWTNPLTSDGTAAGTSHRWLSAVPAVAHEGVKFGADDTLYFIDERNDGSIFKYVPVDPTDLSLGGQSFVLVDDDFVADGGVASENWNSAANSGTDRTGAATWVAMTNADGSAGTTIQDPFVFGVSGSRGGTFLVAIQHPGTGNDALWAIKTPEPASAAVLAISSGFLALRRRNRA